MTTIQHLARQLQKEKKMSTEAVSHLNMRIKQLEDENAELRDENAAMQETIDDLLAGGNEPAEGFDDWD